MVEISTLGFITFITGYAVWSGIALHNLKLEKSFTGNTQYNQVIVRDTIIVEKEKYIYDTLYKVAYVHRVSKEKAVSPVVNKPILGIPSEVFTHQKEILTEVKKIDEKQESILPTVDTLIANLIQKKEEIIIPDENKKDQNQCKSWFVSGGIYTLRFR